ncbi:MAG: alpha/beta hydrolase [Candidatus Saccharimonadales bacterium]
MSEILSTKAEGQIPSTFEDQFKAVKTVESYDGVSEYVDLVPEQLSDETPVVIASGWSTGRKSLRETGEELYRNGRRAVLIDHARRGNAPEDEAGFARDTLQRSQTIIEVLDDAGIDKANVIAHSEGTISATAAALQQPERFDTLVLAMPAGMIGEDTFGGLLKRFAPKTVRSLTKDTVENPNIGLAVNVGGMAYIGKNPAKGYREVRAIAETRIDDALAALRDKGVRTAVLQSNKDSVFPVDRIEKHVRLDGDSANIDSYSSVAVKDAGHDELLIRPQRTVGASLQIIDQFRQ